MESFSWPKLTQKTEHPAGRQLNCSILNDTRKSERERESCSVPVQLMLQSIESWFHVFPCDVFFAGTQVDGVKGCAFCGGLGHRITNCPKIDTTAKQKAGAQRDVLADTGGYGGDW